MSHRLSLRLSFITASLVMVGQTAIAQTPSANAWRTSPLTTFARFHGLGYSDGYHGCKGNECSPKKSWLSGENISSFYGEPSVPPVRAISSRKPSYASYQSAQPMSMSQSPYQADLSPGTTPSPMAPMAPNEIPRPTLGREPEVVIPQLQRPQTRRVFPGTHSLMTSQGGLPDQR
jgi:hypothetical protein